MAAAIGAGLAGGGRGREHGDRRRRPARPRSRSSRSAGLVVWESIRVGGYEMDDAIVDHVQEHAQAADRPGDRRGGEDRDRLGL